MTQGIRAFVAIQVSDPVRETVRSIQARCRDQGMALRPVPPRSVHLTLKFLGDIPAATVASVADILSRCAARTPPMALACRGLGVFPGIKRARVLWLGLTGTTGPLLALHRHINQGLAELGHPVDTRPFRPHLTLGRAKGRLDPVQVAELIKDTAARPDVPFSADSVILWQSRLTPSGAIHTPLAEAFFNPDA